MDLHCGQFLLKNLLLELLFVAFLTKFLGIVSLGLLLFNLTRYLVLLNLFLGLFELFSVLCFHLDLLGVCVALRSFQGPLQLIEVDGVLDSQLLQCGLLLAFLSELSLHVREKRA